MTAIDYIILLGSLATAVLAIWALISKLSKPIKDLVDKNATLIAQNNQQKNANMALMKYHIKEMCTRPLRRGWIMNEEIDEINEMFEIYNSMGGNGSAKSRVERCRNLPIKHHSEPWEVERIR